MAPIMSPESATRKKVLRFALVILNSLFTIESLCPIAISLPALS